VSETLDWARTLTLLAVDEIDGELLAETLPVLLKNQSDIDLAAKELGGTQP
jgi:DNA-binding PucR family transcriptional regulator